MENVVAVIPARGGSKGIPRKNMRLLNGKPLISYAIENALNSKIITDVVVSTDSEEILNYVHNFASVIGLERGEHLAEDLTTLDPVIFDAIERWEKVKGTEADCVVTLQPTSPLLTRQTLDHALEQFLSSSYDSMISVHNAPHLSWGRNDEGEVYPKYEERLNRQALPANLVETGAFLFTKRGSLTPQTRIARSHTVYEVPASESTDIDTIQDWAVCEHSLTRKRIVFRVDAYAELGTGHIFRALTLAYSLTGHDIIFICNSKYEIGSRLLRSSYANVIEVNDHEDLLRVLSDLKPDIFVNDCLDTTTEYIKSIKKIVDRVVTFEDLGSGAFSADAVVNEIYDENADLEKVFSGKKYVCLREEFLTATPAAFSEQVNEVLLLFGGTDPSDLSSRLYEVVRNLVLLGRTEHFTFVLGPGYNGRMREIEGDDQIEIIENTSRVSHFMKKADLAVSSQGRTTFELASLGVPTLVLAQNEREKLHRFAQMDNGFINLGLGSEVSREDLESTLIWLMGATSIRREMHDLMLKNDLKAGIKRVVGIILGEGM